MSGNDRTDAAAGNSQPTLTRRRLLATTATAAASFSGLAAATGAVSAQSGSVPVLDVTSSEPSESAGFPTGADEILLFVHGWQGKDAAASQAGTAADALCRNDYTNPVAAVRWNANDIDFGNAQGDADTAGDRLAAWLDGFLADEPGTSIRVVAHSLGARVSLRMLDAAAGSDVVESVSLLGGAVARDHVCQGAEYGPGIDSAAGSVSNYYSANDDIVCTTYGGVESAGGIGCAGAACDATPSNYTDVDVSGSVGGHMQYFTPGDGCMSTVVDDMDLDPSDMSGSCGTDGGGDGDDGTDGGDDGGDDSDGGDDGTGGGDGEFNFSDPGSDGFNFSEPGSDGFNFSEPGSDEFNFSDTGSDGFDFSEPGSDEFNFSDTGSDGFDFSEPDSDDFDFSDTGSDGFDFSVPDFDF